MESKLHVKNVFVIISILILISLIVIIYNFLWLLPIISLRTYVAGGSSMEPTIKDGDKIIVSTLYYQNHKISRGDLILFSTPQKPGLLYFERIAALGGETIETRDSKILINGAELKKAANYIFDKKAFTLTFNYRSRVPENTVFVLGDNLDYSLDSRAPDMGPVSVENIKGKVLYIYSSDRK